jgi:hypothetical protein
MAVMTYSGALVIPAGTTAASPATDELVTAPGVALLVRLIVPPGPRGEVSLWLEHVERAIAPVPPDTWDQLDDDLVDYPLNIVVTSGMTTFRLVGISPGANFQHTITWQVNVDVSPQFQIPTATPNLFERLIGALGG